MALWSKIGQALRARWYLRRCATFGPRTRVDGKVLVVTQGGTIRLGDRVRIRGTHVPVELAAVGDGELSIGDRTFINSGASICASRQVSIGQNCAVGNFTLIMDNDFHEIGDLNAVPSGQPIIIEDDVWLAARVTVLKGVRIGKGAVVAAGAVVTKDVAPYTLVGGVPARFIRSLRSESEPPIRREDVLEVVS